MDKLPEICALWIGGQLSYMEQLCLQSFLDHGHKVTLYTYEDVKRVPKGVALADANNILSIREKLTKHRRNSPAQMADVFRYHLLKIRPGVIWADADIYCVRPFKPTSGFYCGWENESIVNNAVLALPAKSETLTGLLDLCEDEFGIPPWASKKAKSQYAAAAARRKPVHVSEMIWGIWGPYALTYFMNKTGEIQHAKSVDVFYPVPFDLRRLFFRPPP